MIIFKNTKYKAKKMSMEYFKTEVRACPAHPSVYIQVFKCIIILSFYNWKE